MWRKLRLNLWSKLMLVASLLLAIPFIGYYYIWDMETFLRKGQEQTLMGTARALATALHERPNLFNQQASYKKKLETGKDFLPAKIQNPIRLDGDLSDWQVQIAARNHYDFHHQIDSHFEAAQVSVEFTSQIGRFDDYVYAYFDVKDEQLVYRPRNQLSITDNDYLEIATLNQNQQLQRYIVTSYQSGWVNGYRLPSSNENQKYPQPQSNIQGHWQATDTGYTIELRMPESLLGEKVAFAITDFDRRDLPTITIGSADPKRSEQLGTFTVPSPDIERIIKAMGRSQSSIIVVDQHQRALTQQGNIHAARGVFDSSLYQREGLTWLETAKTWIMAPFYYFLLTKPSSDFTSEEFEYRQNKQSHVQQALTGTPATMWWTTKDNKAVILSAAHPIYVNNQVKGAVIVEETTHGIRDIRNSAIEGVVITSLMIYISVAALLFYALRISLRIRRLRNATEAVVDDHGRIVQPLLNLPAKDEIGDLSRSFANILGQLGQYNNYLQTMSSRLSHELKTPVALVRSSLENLNYHATDDNQQRYLTRAHQGIERLNTMLQTMSEATQLEQALQTSEFITFDLVQLVQGCSYGYQQIYPQQHFSVKIADKPLYISGSDDHIAQLLDKLVSNAVDFSDNDQAIEISLAKHKKSARITITNYGSSLPDDMSQNIFDAMVSLRTNNSDASHLGIGLYISRLIVDHHQGTISAHNLAPGYAGKNLEPIQGDSLADESATIKNHGVSFVIDLPIVNPASN
ncbi:proteobacterial dedicated sortase system histidine kinase [Thalassotalea litorea]|uniref:histidine kinase n=1 Tax=Thalassotalea litorea TaxID=2020715 RepID=A0A5R9IMR8_9GAMM|nr:proteobacterial dedicated sortase system histidine kinase [Thalassotalea litorea]TLU66830.1 proteobacterial dedicated sortase system histidine kinase [Thalassotalea litorea]